MAKHTDGSNTHVVDGEDVRSSHTMLLYLEDCYDGGETSLWAMVNKKKSGKLKSLSATEKRRNRILSSASRHVHEDVLERVQCVKNRMLIFPHACPHEGGLVRLQQKICLRAELYIHPNEKA